MKKIFSNKNILSIIYKLLYDALFLGIFSFTVLLITEAVLPGFLSSHLSPSKMVLGIIAIMSFIAFLGRKLGITYALHEHQKNLLTPVMIIFAFLIIGNSMLRFTLWQNLVITLATLVVFYLFYKILFSSEE